MTDLVSYENIANYLTGASERQATVIRRLAQFLDAMEQLTENEKNTLMNIISALFPDEQSVIKGVAYKYYSEDDWLKIAGIIIIFSDYIEGSKEFEIGRSEKLGCFLMFHFSEEDREILDISIVESADELFEHLLSEIASDVRDLRLAGEHHAADLLPVEAEEVRKRVEPYLARFNEDGRKHYSEMLEDYLAEETEQ